MQTEAIKKAKKIGVLSLPTRARTVQMREAYGASNGKC